ncbi:hypothetical protein BDF14DRAFT_1857734 [Spinellus fusiger]|nr:hypothetical protein BDF14DRAFT_1857734 [Spinellus fusiger]
MPTVESSTPLCSETPLEPKTDTTVNTGLESWLARREEWTRQPDLSPEQQHKHNLSLEQKKAWLEAVSQTNPLGVYQALIVDRRKLTTPLPLGFAIDIIVQGWKHNGTWPEGMEAPKD